jgi:malate/lactate dehydrogenase
VKIKESAVVTAFSNEQDHSAEFTFVGHQGRPFGQPITIRFKVVKKIDELELYQKAMEMFETQKSESNTFEEIVDALKKSGNDPEQAKNILEKKQCGMTVQTEEEDLYA